MKFAYGAHRPRDRVWRRAPRMWWEVGVGVHEVGGPALLGVRVSDDDVELAKDDDVWRLPSESVVRVLGLWGDPKGDDAFLG